MKFNTKNLVVSVLIALILMIVLSLTKSLIKREKFEDKNSLKEINKLLEKMTEIDADSSSVSVINKDITNKLDLIESHIEKLKIAEATKKLTDAEEARNREYLVLKCSPNSEVASFDNSPDVQSQADSNREILQSIYKELDSLA